MKDTHEANLPTEENGKLEETKAPETTPENTAEEVVTNETPDAGVAAEETSEAEGRRDTQRGGSTQTGLLQNPPERSGRIEESIPYSRW